jgi:hypothetical protein
MHIFKSYYSCLNSQVIIVVSNFNIASCLNSKVIFSKVILKWWHDIKCVFGLAVTKIEFGRIEFDRIDFS